MVIRVYVVSNYQFTHILPNVLQWLNKQKDIEVVCDPHSMVLFESIINSHILPICAAGQNRSAVTYAVMHAIKDDLGLVLKNPLGIDVGHPYDGGIIDVNFDDAELLESYYETFGLNKPKTAQLILLQELISPIERYPILRKDSPLMGAYKAKYEKFWQFDSHKKKVVVLTHNHNLSALVRVLSMLRKSDQDATLIYLPIKDTVDQAKTKTLGYLEMAENLKKVFNLNES